MTGRDTVLASSGSILTVCTGNICRSPYAEYRLRAVLGTGDEVASAGTHGLRGWPADPGTEAVARARGFSTGGHGARQVTRELLSGAQLVLGMSADHREYCTDLVPQAAGRIFTLHELAELVRTGAATGGTLQERLEDAHAAREALPRTVRVRKVADPFGQLDSAFVRMADDIDAQLELVAQVVTRARA